MIRPRIEARIPDDIRAGTVERERTRDLRASPEGNAAPPDRLTAPMLKLAGAESAHPLLSGLQPIQPTLYSTEQKHASMYPLVDYKGPLFRGRPKATDVVQNQLGDCDLEAAASALANARPDLAKKLVRPVRGMPGKAVVTFASGDKVEVDAKFATQKKGVILYGNGPGKQVPGKTPIWSPELEKATAIELSEKQHEAPSYNAIGGGGNPSDLLRLWVGGKTKALQTKRASADRLWNLITEALKRHDPSTLTTYDAKDFKYGNDGVVDDHTNTVLASRVVDGVRMVRVRNPWGEYEPGFNYDGKKTGKNDGKDDGQFWLPIEKLKELYEAVQVDHIDASVKKIRLMKKV